MEHFSIGKIALHGCCLLKCNIANTSVGCEIFKFMFGERDEHEPRQKVVQVNKPLCKRITFSYEKSNESTVVIRFTYSIFNTRFNTLIRPDKTMDFIASTVSS